MCYRFTGEHPRRHLHLYVYRDIGVGRFDHDPRYVDTSLVVGKYNTSSKTLEIMKLVFLRARRTGTFHLRRRFFFFFSSRTVVFISRRDARDTVVFNWLALFTSSRQMISRGRDKLTNQSHAGSIPIQFSSRRKRRLILLDSLCVSRIRNQKFIVAEFSSILNPISS